MAKFLVPLCSFWVQTDRQTWRKLIAILRNLYLSNLFLKVFKHCAVTKSLVRLFHRLLWQRISSLSAANSNIFSSVYIRSKEPDYCVVFRVCLAIWISFVHGLCLLYSRVFSEAAGSTLRSCSVPHSETWRPRQVQVQPRLQASGTGCRLQASGTSATQTSSAGYRCNPGFKLVGDTYLTCLHGTWTGNLPTCQEGNTGFLVSTVPPILSTQVSHNKIGFECKFHWSKLFKT